MTDRLSVILRDRPDEATGDRVSFVARVEAVAFTGGSTEGGPPVDMDELEAELEALFDARYDHAGDAEDAVTDHEAAADPHLGYLTPARGDARYDPLHAGTDAVTDHVGQTDPHSQYLTQGRGDLRYYRPVSGLVLTDPDFPAALARDTEVQAAILALVGGATTAGDTLGELEARIALIEAIGSLASDAELLASIAAIIGSADTAGDTLGELEALINARLRASQNLSDVQDAATAANNLLLAIATTNGDMIYRAAGVLQRLATTIAGRAMLTAADATAQRVLLGLGTAALVDTGTGAANVPTITQADARYASTTDSRLSNARTPTAHAATHGSGGSDPVTIAESQVTGLVSDLAAKANTSALGTAAAANTGTGASNVPTTAQADGRYGTIADAKAEVLMVALGDETTAITTGTKVKFRMPFAMTLSSVRASLVTASSSGIPTVNIKESGTTIFSTKLTIDATELTSTTAATAAVLSDTSLADDAEITLDVDVAGTGATGLKVYLIGTRT